jgi:uncharacterized protein
MRYRPCRSRLALFLAAGFWAFLATASTAASAAPASRESVEELIRVMRLEQTSDDSDSMMESMRAQIENQLDLDAPSEERLAESREKVQAFIREELSWGKLRDLYVKVYAETYSQEEVDGQLAFYRSPEGQATLDKQPVLLEKTALAMQELMAGVMAKHANRGRGTDEIAQKRTVADVRNVGTAMLSWLTDQAAAGAAAAAESTTVNLKDYPSISREKLESILVPQYIQSIPEKDGWGHPYEFFLNTENPIAAEVMAIRSPGRDGSFSGRSYEISAFEPASFDEDIIWVDGFFARWPQKQPTSETK